MHIQNEIEIPLIGEIPNLSDVNVHHFIESLYI